MTWLLWPCSQTGALASSMHLLLVRRLHGAAHLHQPALGHLHCPDWHLARPEIVSWRCRKRSLGTSPRVHWMGALRGALATCSRSASMSGPCWLRADC